MPSNKHTPTDVLGIGQLIMDGQGQRLADCWNALAGAEEPNRAVGRAREFIRNISLWECECVYDDNPDAGKTVCNACLAGEILQLLGGAS